MTSWHRQDADGRDRWEAIRDTYTGAIIAAGGLPLILPIVGDDGLLMEYLDALHGILFTGGEDIAPAYYGETRDERCQEPDPERDLFEIGLARHALDRRLPALGICRGMQLLNVAAGGTLYQDIACRPGTRSHHAGTTEDRGKLIHEVHLVPESRLASLMRVSRSFVTSTHHQFIKDLAPGFCAAAHSADDGIIEAMESATDPFTVAVQWHPERIYRERPEHLALFAGLVDAAGRTA